MADFYCHEKQLVVELDGAIHRYQEYKDKKREELIRSMGVRVVRFENDHVESRMEQVKEQLEKHIAGKLSPSLHKRRGRACTPEGVSARRRGMSSGGTKQNTVNLDDDSQTTKNRAPSPLAEVLCP